MTRRVAVAWGRCDRRLAAIALVPLVSLVPLAPSA